jgi:DNA-binding MarR family transcriptional regulator
MVDTDERVARIEEALLGLILRANRARIYEDLLQGANVSMDKALYPVLSATAAMQPARVSAIATAVGLNATTTSRHLTGLEKLGLVTRARDDADARSAVIELSPAGRLAVTELRDSRRRIFGELLAGFDQRELERFAEYLDRIVAAFKDQ